MLGWTVGARMAVSSEWIVPDTEFSSAAPGLVGGKAVGLGALIACEAPVPRAFALTTSAYRAAAFTPEALEHKIRAAVAELQSTGARRFAVRSSHPAEDVNGAGAPGIYHSEVGPDSADEVVEAVRRVWASAATPAALEYQRRSNAPFNTPTMAVLIQEAPPVAVGGVVYTLLPDEADPSALLVEYGPGPPANVINNLVPPQRCVVSKRSPHGAAPAPDPTLLTAQQLDVLVTWSLRVEDHLDAPVDLEWLLTPAGNLWLLQARRLPFPEVDPEGPYIAPANGTGLRSEKLAPFRLAHVPGVTTIGAHLILPAAFAAFAAAGGRVPDTVLDVCCPMLRRYCARGPVSIRSAFWSARHSADMLPQSPPLTTVDDCVMQIVQIWRSALASRHLDYTAELALLVSHWIPPRASAIAVAGRDNAPVIVSALNGQMEGLETCAHDTYHVDPHSLAIRESQTPHKQRAVLSPGEPPVPLPPLLQDRPVLSDGEVRACARTTNSIAAHLGPVRVEFLVRDGDQPPGERVVTWQVTALAATADLRYFEVRSPRVHHDDGAPPLQVGRLVLLRDPAEVARLKTGCGDEIIAIDFERFWLRDPEMAAGMAATLREFGRPTVIKGSILSHFVALLREYGVAVYPVNELPDAYAGHMVELVTVRTGRQAEGEGT
jgi:hypothetical protein